MKKKLRDITPEEWSKIVKDYCYGNSCGRCTFRYVYCTDGEDVWANNKDLYSDKFLDQEIEIEMPPKTIPRCQINDRWKWVARDEDNSLFLYENKPTKKRSLWDEGIGHHCNITGLIDKAFEDVKWSDNEPTRIED